MTRYVIGPDVAMHLAESRMSVPTAHKLLAPTLLRSQVLAHLYGEVQRGVLAQREAERRLDYLRALRIRLFGDRVLQSVAWKIAAQLGWKDTFVAEYVALTQLQADALVTFDEDLAKAVSGIVATASIDELLRAQS